MYELFCGSYNYIMQLIERGDNEMVTSTILSDMKSKVELLTNALDNESDKRQRFEDQVCGYLHQETYNTYMYMYQAFIQYVCTYLSIYLSTCTCIYLSIYLSIYISMNLSITHLCLLRSSLFLFLSLFLLISCRFCHSVPNYPKQMQKFLDFKQKRHGMRR